MRSELIICEIDIFHIYFYFYLMRFPAMIFRPFCNGIMNETNAIVTILTCNFNAWVRNRLKQTLFRIYLRLVNMEGGRGGGISRADAIIGQTVRLPKAQLLLSFYETLCLSVQVEIIGFFVK